MVAEYYIFFVLLCLQLFTNLSIITITITITIIIYIIISIISIIIIIIVNISIILCIQSIVEEQSINILIGYHIFQIVNLATILNIKLHTNISIAIDINYFILIPHTAILIIIITINNIDGL
jgi:hypothetical protein